MMNSRSFCPGTSPSPGRIESKLMMPSEGKVWLSPPSGKDIKAVTSCNVKMPDVFMRRSRTL